MILTSTQTRPLATSKSRPRHRGLRSLVRLLMASVFAAMLLLTTAGAASADTFSPWVPPQRYSPYFGDCTVTVGPVYDPYTSSHGFAVIGGVNVACGSRHNIQAWVQEAYSPSGAAGSYYFVGQYGYTYFANSYGFGAGRILETSRICGAGYWYTVATISVSGYGTYKFPSVAKSVTAAGAGTTWC